MFFKSIDRRVSMLAVLGLFPTAFVAGEVREQLDSDRGGTMLMGQVEEVARDIQHNADRLDSFTRSGQVSTGTHKDYLTQIKSLVNEGLVPTLNRLTEMQPDLPEWQQDAIDRMLESVKALAANTNSAILNLNETGNLPVLLNADHREFVSQINEHAEALVKTADAAGAYAEARQKAVEAGLNVPEQ